MLRPKTFASPYPEIAVNKPHWSTVSPMPFPSP